MRSKPSPKSDGPQGGRPVRRRARHHSHADLGCLASAMSQCLCRCSILILTQKKAPGTIRLRDPQCVWTFSRASQTLVLMRQDGHYRNLLEEQRKKPRTEVRPAWLCPNLRLCAFSPLVAPQASSEVLVEEKAKEERKQSKGLRCDV